MKIIVYIGGLYRLLAVPAPAPAFVRLLCFRVDPMRLSPQQLHGCPSFERMNSTLFVAKLVARCEIVGNFHDFRRIVDKVVGSS